MVGLWLPSVFSLLFYIYVPYLVNYVLLSNIEKFPIVPLFRIYYFFIYILLINLLFPPAKLPEI